MRRITEDGKEIYSYEIRETRTQVYVIHITQDDDTDLSDELMKQPLDLLLRRATWVRESAPAKATKIESVVWP